MLILTPFVFIASLLALIWSANRFVAGAASLARRLGMSMATVGLTVVALGTSAPEILVSATAAWQGSTALALGNAQGSNIANIGLVLGMTLLLARLPVSVTLLRSQSLIFISATVILGIMLYDRFLGRFEGIILLTGLALFIAWTLWQSQHNAQLAAAAAEEAEQESSVEQTLWSASWITASGLLILLLASRGLVWSAVDMARTLGVSELVIGATIVAIGTSLPELAAAFSSTLKGHHGMTLGNILGSNVFNIFAVVGVAGMIAPAGFEPAVWHRDYLFVLLSALSLFALMQLYGRNSGSIPRPFGLLLMVGYALYLWLNFRALNA